MLVIFLCHSLKRKASPQSEALHQAALESWLLKSLQVSPTKEWRAQVPENPSLSGTLLLVNLPGTLPKAEAGEPVRNPAGFCHSPTSALLKWKWSVQNILISVKQQVPMKMHSDLLLWKNRRWLRWSFPIFLWKKCFMRIFLISLTQAKPQMHLLTRSPSDKETCIALSKQIFLLCKPGILFLPYVFHTRGHNYSGSKLGQYYVHNQWTRLVDFLPAFPRTFFWVLV